MVGVGGNAGQFISFDNYEANTKYFPLIWKKEVNPYQLLKQENAKRD